MQPPYGFRFEFDADGSHYLWPDFDRKCAAVVFNMAADLDAVMKHVRKPGVVVQAGGNCGVWPRRLGGMFDAVYTFEPDPRNFAALAFNTRDHANVVKFQAAVGDRREMVTIGFDARDHDNGGAGYVTRGGVVPTMRIDDLNLHACDLIYLDVEGFELAALRGAASTIQNCGPVIALEDKGLSSRYGVAKGDAEVWLKQFGYEVVERIHRDVILAPANRS